MRVLRCLILGVLMTLASAPVVFAQATPATYAERALLSTDNVFEGRILVGMLITVAAVLAEPDTVADSALRTRFAGYALRDPNRVSRVLSQMLASNIAVETNNGVTNTTLTDVQLQAFIAQRWTALAKAFMAGYSNVP
jgi:hypothetical protein